MKIKLLYDELFVGKENINPKYIARRGTIVDIKSGKILYKLPGIEISQFFYFKLVFDSHKLNTYYCPKSAAYHKKVCGRNYQLFLYLDIPMIIANRGYTMQLYKKIQQYLIFIQTKQLTTKNNYHINGKWIKQFILYREEFAMYLIPWNYFRIDNNIAFDLKNKKIVAGSQIKKINFSRKGGIIETNNVNKLVEENFINRISMEKTIVILPKKFVNLWKTAHIITFEELFLFSQTEIASFKNLNITLSSESSRAVSSEAGYTGSFDSSITLSSESVITSLGGKAMLEALIPNITHVIIHECHAQLLSGIKKLIAILDCKIVWVINSLPLRYYFPSEKPIDKLNINNLETLTNLWIDFSVDDKRKYKTELFRLFFTKFSHYYSIINYEFHEKFDTISLSLGNFEKNIFRELNEYYYNWKNKLTNDEKNIYSIASQKKIDYIESKIFDTMILLATNIKPVNDIKKIFGAMIKYTLFKVQSVNKNVDRLMTSYVNASKLSNKIRDREIIDFDNIISDLEDKKKITESIIKNYQRYSNNDYVKLLDPEVCAECSVCYSSDDTIKTILICGHIICFECLIGTIAAANKCPMCSEYITLQKIIILQETIKNYHSNIINFLNNIDYDKTIILTNLCSIDNISTYGNHKLNVINVGKPVITHKLREIKNANNIMILTCPDKILTTKPMEEIYKIVGYAKLYNKNIKITKIEINIS